MSELRAQAEFRHDPSRSTVYVVQVPTRRENGAWIPTVDLSSVTDHGRMEVLLPSGMNYVESSAVLAQLRPKLDGFDEENDYLLPVGDPVAMAAAAALLGARCKRFRMLKWDRIHKRYFIFTITLQKGQQ